MDDNVHLNQAYFVEEFLESKEKEQAPWLAKSPVLNPMEKLWDYLGKAV